MCYRRETLKVQKFRNDLIDLHFNIFIWTKFVPSELSLSSKHFHFLVDVHNGGILVSKFHHKRKADSLTSNNLFIGHSRQD